MIKYLIISMMQVLYLSSSILGFGFSLNYITTRANAYINTALGWKGIVATGFIGTPIHEFGHLLFAVIFNHKIDDVKLFPSKSDNGIFGYVQHSYNPSNFYHLIGNFFIGIGPMFSGTLALILLMKLLLPESFLAFKTSINTIMDGNLNGNYISKFIMAVLSSLKSLISFKNFTDIKFYIYLILGMGIAGHMSLSWSDIRNSFIGFLFISLLFFAINIFFVAIGRNVNTLILKFTNLNFYLSVFFSISVLFALLYLLFGIIIFRITR